MNRGWPKPSCPQCGGHHWQVEGCPGRDRMRCGRLGCDLDSYSEGLCFIHFHSATPFPPTAWDDGRSYADEAVEQFRAAFPKTVPPADYGTGCDEFPL